MTYTLSALAELPGYLICVPMMEYWGRRPTLISVFAVGGASCVTVGILNGRMIIFNISVFVKIIQVDKVHLC